MPQGSLKKIEVDLLLTDLALKLRNPALRQRQLVQRRAAGITGEAAGNASGLPLSIANCSALVGRPRLRNATGPPSRNRYATDRDTSAEHRVRAPTR